MGIQEEKPDLNLEYFSTNGNSATFRKDMNSDVPNSLQLTMGNCNNNNTIHIDNEGKSSPARSDHLQANSESLSECGGPSLQLMSCSMETCSNGESSVNNSGLQLMSEGSKREFSFLGGGYFQKGKKRRQEDGSMCRRSPSVRSSTPPPMSPAYNGSSVSHVSGGHQFHLQESSQSSVQKPVATIQPVQVQGPVNQHSCSSIQSSPQCSAFHEPASDLAIRKAAVRSWGNQPLSATDPDLWDIMEKEKQRQWKGIELIASENFVCQGVIEALGSHLTNKYSEGMPGSRYYGGNEYIDQIESLCCERALTAFCLDPEKWGVNVQPYSCTSANFAVYTGLLQPKDRIMGLDSPSGGHLSHGYYTSSGKKVSGASIFFESLPYKVNPHTGYIDFEKLEEKALDFRPKILICGGSSYPREWDYARFRQITDKCGAVLMCDMAQISGLVAAGECSSPFDYCDIVTSTTHKSLRGPRGGMIFYRKGSKPRKRGSSLYQGEDTEHYDFEEKINFAVFPSLQGGPHNNHVAALAVAFKQAATPEYKAYIQQVKKNAQALASTLLKWNCRLVTGGTDNHLLLWDLRPLGLTGNRFEKVCETCHITVNKNAVFGDSGAMAPGGVRIGTPAMTSRGCVEKDFKIMAEFLVKAAQIATNVQREHGKIQRDFLKGLQNNKEIAELRASVEKFASQFEMPGFDISTMKYNTT